MFNYVPIAAALVWLVGCDVNTDAEQPATEIAPVTNDVSFVDNDVASSQSDRTIIVFLGDSLTAGFGLSADDALPEQVARRLTENGVSMDVVNAGVSGDTTANGLARYDWSVASADPDLLVVALGANDYLMGLSPDVTRGNLAAIIERAQSDGTPIVLAGLEPRSDAGAGSRDEAFAAIYPGLAEEYGVPLYPALLASVRDTPEFLQSDGTHPNAEGVLVMANRLSAYLVPHLEGLAE